MISDVVEKRIVDNLDRILETIGDYLGDNFKEGVLNRGEKIRVALMRGSGVVKISDGEVYVGNEPVCVKDGGVSYIYIPVNLLGDKYGNVVFIHMILHAVFGDSFKEKYDDLNEVLVDYIADDVAKMLEEKEVNITLEKNPSYTSNSFYSQFFSLVENFYISNKRDIFNVFVNDNDVDIPGVEELSKRLEQAINSLLFNDIDEVIVNKVKR